MVPPMYSAYKLIQLVLLPGVWVVAGMVASLWYLRRNARRSRILLALTLFLFMAVGTGPLPKALVRPLERPFVPPAAGFPKQEAIVVLAGGAHWLPDSHQPTVLGTASLPRLVEGIVLYRLGVAPVLIFSGGVGDPRRTTPPEASAMKSMALSLGVPEEAIKVDDDSRTTAESAAEVRKQFPELKRIALVTSAIHLGRSVPLFQKQGFEVAPAAADYLANGDGWSFGSMVPGPDGLREVESAVHEEVGRWMSR